MTCCAIGCRTRSGQGKKFFSIPSGKRDETRRKEWLRRIRRAHFNATPSTRLCEDHFTIDQFERIALERYGIKKLRPDAVPTIFSYEAITPKRGGKNKKVLAKGRIRTTRNSCLFKPTRPPRLVVKPAEDNGSQTKVQVHQLGHEPQTAWYPGNLQGNGLQHKHSTTSSSPIDGAPNLFVVGINGADEHEATEAPSHAGTEPSTGVSTGPHRGLLLIEDEVTHQRDDAQETTVEDASVDAMSGPAKHQENGFQHEDSSCTGPEELQEVTGQEMGNLQSEGSAEREERSHLVIVSVHGAGEHEMTEDTEPIAEIVDGLTQFQPLGMVGHGDQRESEAAELGTVAYRSQPEVQFQSTGVMPVLSTSQHVSIAGGGEGPPLNVFLSHLEQGQVCKSTADKCPVEARPRDIGTQSKISSGHGPVTCPQVAGCPEGQGGGQHVHGVGEARVPVASKVGARRSGKSRPQRASVRPILPYPSLCTGVPAGQHGGAAVQVEATRNTVVNGVTGYVHQASSGGVVGDWHSAVVMGGTPVLVTESFASSPRKSVLQTGIVNPPRPEVAPPDVGAEPPPGVASGPHCGLLRIRDKGAEQHGTAPERTGEEPANMISGLGATFSPLQALGHVVTVDAGALAAMLERRPLKTEEDLRERIDDLEDKLLRAQKRLALSRARSQRVELENRALRAQVQRLMRAPAIRYARHRRREGPPPPEMTTNAPLATPC